MRVYVLLRQHEQKRETKTKKKEASNLIILSLHCCLYKEFAGPLDQIDKKVG